MELTLSPRIIFWSCARIMDEYFDDNKLLPKVIIAIIVIACLNIQSLLRLY